jgi:cyclopropane-fatty-acyl-phospholipid synthase
VKTADTSQHYELDPEVFGLFLDPMRKYSCALYESPADTLDQAQVRKLHFVADRLGLRGGERLLDVGCGWGSMVLFMAREYGCGVVGISPSGPQRGYIERRAAALGVADRVEIRTGYFEEAMFGDERFDAITMLGSIVHMPDLTGVYRKARSLLRRGGRLYVSESCFRTAELHDRFDADGGTQFIREVIYGAGEMRPLSDFVRAAEEAGLSITSVDDLTDNYRRTIDDWRANVLTNADRIDALRPGMVADMVRYFDICNAAWGYTTKHYALVCSRSR